MKKIFSSRIFTFVLGFIAASAIGVYAINAGEITYKSTTVEGAINELYNLSLRDLTFDNIITNGSYGDQEENRSASITLNTGKYLVIAMKNRGWATSSTITTTRNNTGYAGIDCTNNCTYQQLSTYEYLGIPSSAISGVYPRLNTRVTLFYVDVVADNTTVSTSWLLSNDTYAVEDIEIMAVPVTK